MVLLKLTLGEEKRNFSAQSNIKFRTRDSQQRLFKDTESRLEDKSGGRAAVYTTDSIYTEHNRTRVDLSSQLVLKQVVDHVVRL